MKREQSSPELTPKSSSESPSGTVVPFPKKQRKVGRVTVRESDIERKRRKAREWYRKNRKRLRKEAVQRYHAKQKGKRLSARDASGKKGPVRAAKTLDAMILINRVIVQIEERDWEGAEIYAKLTRRALQGKE